jgi:hypothetical protein
MSLIYAGLAAVRDHLAEKGLAKNQTNQHQGFKFRGIDDLYGVLQQALQASGVVMIPNLGSVERKEQQIASKPDRDGNYPPPRMQFFTTAFVRYTFVSVEDGSSVEVYYAGEAADTGDKSLSKALTMALKYMAFHTFQIPLNGNEDGDKETAEDTAAPVLDQVVKDELEAAAKQGVGPFRDYWKTLDGATRKLAQGDKKWFDSLRETAEGK